MHIHRRHTGMQTGCRPTKAKIVHNTGLATQKRWRATHYADVLANQAHAGNSQWHCHKGKRKIILLILHSQILEQLYINHRVIEKMRLIARQSVHCKNMNADIKSIIRQCATCLEYEQTQTKRR